MSCPCTVNMIQSTSMIVRGDTAMWVMRFCVGSEPVDVTGWDMYLIIRDSKDVEESTFTRIVKHTIAASADATNGIATISIQATDSADFPPGKYYYEFKRVITTVDPPDVWTFVSPHKADFEVRDGYVLFE